ncbi:MAG: hypothetical protein AB1597_02870 [Chloroflexota bacterium]
MVESKCEIRAEAPVSVAGVTVVRVFEQVVCCDGRRGGLSFVAVKRPVAVVVGSSSGWRVFRASGEEMTFDEFREEFSGLKMPYGGLA